MNFIKAPLRGYLQKRNKAQLKVPCPLLHDIFATYTVQDAQQVTHPLDANISAIHANALYETVKLQRPQVVVEVGMAFGIASLAILTALQELGQGGRLISIDPFQSTNYKAIGVGNVEKAGFINQHTLIEKLDYLALPQLIEQDTKIDFAYIDGWHTFDYTLLDFFFIDKMLAANGVVAFNDCAMPAVHKVLGYVKTHRHYTEMNVGLNKNYLTSSPWLTLKQMALGLSKADRYFQKNEVWEPPWDYWKVF